MLLSARFLKYCIMSYNFEDTIADLVTVDCCGAQILMHGCSLNALSGCVFSEVGIKDKNVVALIRGVSDVGYLVSVLLFRFPVESLKGKRGCGEVDVDSDECQSSSVAHEVVDIYESQKLIC